MTVPSTAKEGASHKNLPQGKAVPPCTLAANSTLLRLQRMATSVSLLRAVREIAIVTVGILIAFALNTWWEDRKEQKQEQQHLRSLASDFEQNIASLEALSKSEDSVASNSIELLQAARGVEKLSPEQIRVLMRGVFTSGRFQPVMGAYEALVKSAGLTLVQNEKLRASLANFAAAVTGRYGERLSDEMYLAFIREFAGRLQLSVEVTGAAPSPQAYAHLLADPKFQEYLALRNLAEGQMGTYYRDLLHQSQEILGLLRHEIR